MTQVDKNGIISLRGLISSTFPLQLNRSLPHPIIAPYWADVDIRTGNIFYRQSSEPSLLARATREVQSAFPASSNVNIKNLLIATWDAVSYRSYRPFDRNQVSIQI